jgi:DNA polymerase elongation subunit (family B)
LYQNAFFDGRSVHIWDDKRGYFRVPYKKYAYTLNKKGKYITLDGRRVQKTFRFDKDDPNIYESDVQPIIRTLVDQYTQSDEPSVGHRLMIFDIEVEVTEGFPSPQLAENKITSIALWDDLTKEYYVMVLDPENKLELKLNDSGIGHKTLEGGKKYIESYKTEEELLGRFINKYREIRPTIITGWNIDNFDIPYIYNRMTLLLGSNVSNLLSPIQRVKYSEFKNRFEIAGVSCIDYLQIYRKFTPNEVSSYRLDDVGFNEVGENKISYEGTLNELYENDRKKFVDYNLHDVKIVVEIDKKLDYINIAKGICHIGHVPYEDIYWSSRYLEGALLTYCKKRDIVVPNKNRDARKLMGKDDKFVGAYVQDPIKGRHEWVYDLDVTSMYPSVIRSLNISPETKIGKVDGWNAEEFVRNTVKTYTLRGTSGKEAGKLSEEQLKYYLDNNKVSIASNGVIYRTDKQGLIPAILTQWFDDRVQFRKLAKEFADSGDMKQYEYYDRRQYLQKILLNSLYGVLGLPIFRFYDIDNAEATTLGGQELIRFSKNMVNVYYNKTLKTKNDNNVIYIDTDSIFASAVPLVRARHPEVDINSTVTMTQYILNIASEIQDFLNSSYDIYATKFHNIKEHYFDIKQELIARAGLFVTKKRYGMKIINDGGIKVDKMLVRGLDTVRSSFAPALKELLSSVLDDILQDVPKDKIDERIFKFKKSMKAMDYSRIASPTGVKKVEKFIVKTSSNLQDRDSGNIGGKLIYTHYKKATPVHVKAALSYNDMMDYYGYRKYPKIRNGDKIKWVYLKNNPLGLASCAYLGHEDPPKILEFIKQYIDINKIYTQALKKKLNMFYEALGWEEPVDVRYTLDRFF